MIPEKHISDMTNNGPIGPECPNCDSLSFGVEEREQTFAYGRGTEAVSIRCVVPVYKCSQCGCEWTSSVAEEIRHEAVCRNFNRLTPRKVRSVREQSGLSQAEFSRITGFGEASLSRWETGAQLQNAACDRMLRLIAADPRNLSRLRQMADAEKLEEIQFRLITITPELRNRQRLFQLRGPGLLRAS